MRAAGALTATGGLLLVAAPGPAVALAGWTLVGAGVALAAAAIVVLARFLP